MKKKLKTRELRAGNEDLHAQGIYQETNETVSKGLTKSQITNWSHNKKTLFTV
jgi:hypothetical protein